MALYKYLAKHLTFTIEALLTYFTMDSVKYLNQPQHK